MITTKSNGKGAQGVTTQSKTTVKTSNNTENPAVEKTTPSGAVELPTKPKTLKEQLAYFEGLEELVEKRRVYEGHLIVVKSLQISKSHADEFELNDDYSLRIELVDSERKNYKIKNPRLVAEMRDYLISLIQAKMAEIDTDIIGFTA